MSAASWNSKANDSERPSESRIASFGTSPRVHE
jgi:hypothetical protein